MKIIVGISTILLLQQTKLAKSQKGVPAECLSAISRLGLCMGTQWQLCQNCLGGLPGGETEFASACEAAEHFECELGGCCLCSEQEVTKCIRDNAGETCDDPVDCSTFFSAQDTDASIGSCGFCPGGLGIENENAMFGEVMFWNGTSSDGSLTCGELHLALQRTPDYLCSVSQQLVTIRSDYPDQCGYCVIPEEGVVDSCTLCPDGSMPTAPADTIVNQEDDESCGFFHIFALGLDPDTGACADVHQIGIDSCGCTSDADQSNAENAPTSSGSHIGVVGFLVIGVTSLFFTFLI